MECNVGTRPIPSSKRSPTHEHGGHSTRNQRGQCPDGRCLTAGKPLAAIGAAVDFRRIIDADAAKTRRTCDLRSRLGFPRPFSRSGARMRGRVSSKPESRPARFREPVGAERQRCYSSLVAEFRHVAEVLGKRPFPRDVALIPSNT